MTVSHLKHRTRDQTSAAAAKRGLRKTKGRSNLTCRACDFKNCGLSMESKYYRSSSPGSRKLAIPGRSSTGTFGSGSSYDTNHSSYSRSPRDEYNTVIASPRTTESRGGGVVVPTSSEPYYPPPPPSSTSFYSGRPRRATLTGTDPAAPVIRTRPTVVQGSTVVRPSSPLSRNYESTYDHRDLYAKPPTATRTQHKKMYSVDSGSAQLIAETQSAPREPRDYVRRERATHHPTASSKQPREIDDASYSYTDPEGMYRDTEPRWRRRSSIDRDPRRPTSVIDPFGLSSRPSRDQGPPLTTRGFDKISDLARSGSLRDPVRSSSRDRNSTYDPYYDVPLRSSSTMPPIVPHSAVPHSAVPHSTVPHSTVPHSTVPHSVVPHPAENRRDTREDRYYRDDYDDVRDPRRSRQFKDHEVETRGFGIRRSSSADRNNSSSSSAEALASRAPRALPPAVNPAAAIYGSDALVVMPSTKDYLPSPVRDERRESMDRREREREWVKEREYERPREKERDYDHERARDKERDYDRERPRDKDRGYDRDYDRERHRDKERDYDRDRPRRDHDDRVKDVVPVATAAGIATAGAAIDKRSRDKKYDSDEERSRRAPRHEPNDREDERERRYAERDIEERRKERREKEEIINPDEEYHRRVQQAELELSKQRSRDDDPDRRRDPRGREERDVRPRRKDSQDDIIPPKEARRDRDEEFRAPAAQQPDRFDGRHNSSVDKPAVQGPEVVSRDLPAVAGAAAPTVVATAPTPDMALRDRDPSSDGGRRVKIVEPPRKEPSPEPPVKGILRKPTQKFPEDPNPIREGVAPLKERLKKESSAKEIPSNAKWTKIDRKLVNPQALEEKGERFEERLDCVIVLRVLTKDEIAEFAERTREIRDEREERYRRDHDSGHKHKGQRDDDDSSDPEREHRHRRDRERERERSDREKDRGRSDRDKDHERDRHSHRRRDHDDDYSTEEESTRKAIEDGRKKGRREEDEYMSGGIGR